MVRLLVWYRRRSWSQNIAVHGPPSTLRTENECCHPSRLLRDHLMQRRFTRGPPAFLSQRTSRKHSETSKRNLFLVARFQQSLVSQFPRQSVTRTRRTRSSKQSQANPCLPLLHFAKAPLRQRPAPSLSGGSQFLVPRHLTSSTLGACFRLRCKKEIWPDLHRLSRWH